jgi:iron complex transport system substrate-binding protein
MIGNDYRAIDATGREISLKRPAKRIVCLTATGIDILAELGLEPVGYLAQGIADRPEFYGDRAQQFAPVGSWMLPNLRAIQQLQPDLILGWVFPHRFYRPWLQKIAPTFFLSGNGYHKALERLRQIACLTGAVAEAEAAVQRLETQLVAYRALIPETGRQTVLMMGGSTLNCLRRRFIVETTAGTVGNLLQQLAHYPWMEPEGKRFEPGLMGLSLDRIAQVNPEVIFIQTYPPARASLSEQLASHPQWQQLQAVQQGRVHEVEQFWHAGSGTRMIQVILAQLLPLIYPEQFLQS